MSRITHIYSARSRKFRGGVEGVHLDIYVPHESQLGARLKLKVEALAEYVDADIAPPWLLLTIDAYFVTNSPHCSIGSVRRSGPRTPERFSLC